MYNIWMYETMTDLSLSVFVTLQQIFDILICLKLLVKNDFRIFLESCFILECSVTEMSRFCLCNSCALFFLQVYIMDMNENVVTAVFQDG